jgi:hypothetical protein
MRNIESWRGEKKSSLPHRRRKNSLSRKGNISSPVRERKKIPSPSMGRLL